MRRHDPPIPTETRKPLDAWLRGLRLLDAEAEGAPNHEIAPALFEVPLTSPAYKTFRSRKSEALASARAMRDHGWKRLLFTTPPQHTTRKPYARKR